MFSAGQAVRMENYTSANLGALIQKANVVCLGGSGPTCDDGIQNGDEDGIDCGGSSCPPCNTTACNAPDNLNSSKERGGSRLRLSWNSVSSADSYNVDFRASGASSWDNYSTSNTSLLITGLSKKSSYEWRVQSVCGTEVSNWASASAQTREPGISIEDLLIYPNPASSIVSINLPSALDFEDTQIEIYDILGQRLIQVETDNFLINVDVHSFLPGTYFLKIESGSTRIIEKFNIMR